MPTRLHSNEHRGIRSKGCKAEVSSITCGDLTDGPIRINYDTAGRGVMSHLRTRIENSGLQPFDI